MWIWGGKSNGYMNDLAHYDPLQNAWVETLAEGSVPSRRYGHSAVAYGDHMYIYGGYDDYGFPCNDVHAFSFERLRWRALKSLGPSPDRFHHSAVLWQGSMYVFGGYGGFADLFEYRLGSCTWTALQTHAPRPEPRWGHRAVEHRGAMYVVGGCDSVLSYSDVWRLDLERRTWTRLPPAEGHAQRFFHASCVYRERLYTFGGKNMHNFAFNDVLQQELLGGVARIAERPDTLLSDLERLCASAASTGDVRLEWPDAPPLHAHSVVLLARSVRLLRWLQQRAQLAPDGRTGVVRLKSKHGAQAAWALLLRYVYSSLVLFASLPSPTSPPHSPLSPHHGGVLNFTPLSADAQLALAVLRLAHKFELDHLKAACEARVQSTLTVEQTLEVLVLADDYCAPDLLDYCMRVVAASPELYAHAKRTDALPRDLLLAVKRLVHPPAPRAVSPSASLLTTPVAAASPTAMSKNPNP